MIWFFIAGWISGAVAMFMYANWWVRKHMVTIKLPPLNEEKENEEDERD